MMRQRVARSSVSVVVCLLLLLATMFDSTAAISSPRTILSSNKKVVVDITNKDAGDVIKSTRGGDGFRISNYDYIVPFGWGDHPLQTSLGRWTWCVGYWLVCGIAAHFLGTIDKAVNQEWLAPNAWYVVGLVIHLPIFMGAWDWSAFSFHRPFRFFATIVYPLMHNFDTLMWFTVFDFGKLILSTLLGETSKFWQFIVGWFTFALFMIWHRGFLELRCLPEHHPLPSQPEPSEDGRGSKFLYVLAGIISSIPTMAIYHFFGDMRWGLMLQYAFNVYVAIRIRLGNPWDPDDGADKLTNEKEWLPYMNEKSY